MNLNDYVDAGAIIACAAVYLFNEIRKELRIKKSTRRRHTLDDSIAIDGRIYPILWDILVTYKALRVYVIQFHNGSNFYTGQSIQRKTVSHEVGQRLIRKVKDYYDNVLISEMFHKILMDMRKGGYFLVNTRDQADEDLAEWMRMYECESLFYLQIQDKRTKETVATLNIHFDRKDALAPMDINDILELKKRLEAIFDEL